MSTGDDPHELRFGPHTKQVEEVIAFVESGGVLPAPFRAGEFRDFNTRVVHSLDDVVRYRDDSVPRTELWSTSEMWWDIRQNGMEEFYPRSDTIPRYWDEFAPKIIEASEMIQVWLSEDLSDVLPTEQIINISDDFEMIMQRRAVFGGNNYIDEKFFRVYQASGYPCGWIGEFPAGELVVFSR